MYVSKHWSVSEWDCWRRNKMFMHGMTKWDGCALMTVKQKIVQNSG